MLQLTFINIPFTSIPFDFVENLRNLFLSLSLPFSPSPNSRNDGTGVEMTDGDFVFVFFRELVVIFD